MIRRSDPAFPRGHGEGGGGRYCSIRPIPHHITALYMTMVFSCVIMFHAALVGADVLVYSQATHYLVEGVEFPDAPARFGGQMPIEGVKGMLVYAKPATACSPIDGPPKGRMFTGKWIVLIRRCGCTFEEKVRNAERAGFDAAIVHNVNSSDLEPMSANGITNITIPSVFVGEESGLIIRERYQYDMGYYIWINDDTPFNINTHLLVPFAIAVGICFMVMVSVMIIKCIKDRIHARRHRLPSSSLKKIPVSKFKKNDPYETCAICLEDYLEGDKLRILPCSHAYHCKCIDPWLTCNRRVCPMCKRKVFAHNERIPDDDDDDDDDSRSGNGGAQTPGNRYSTAVSSDTSEDERAPLISNNRSQSGRSRRGNTRGGGTFRPQRENPFCRAARSLTRNPFAAGRSNPQATTREEDRNSISSSSTTTSHEDPNSMVDSTPATESSSESANQAEARPNQDGSQVVHACEHDPSSARMSVNSSPADIQDVATLPVDPQEERHQGDLVV